MRFHLIGLNLEPRPPAPASPQSLAAELAERCYPPLRRKPWPDRLAALGEMHDQLRRDLPDGAVFRATFPLFVALLVDRFGNPPIGQQRDAREHDAREHDGWRAQAGIYANSARPEHRRAAAAARDRPLARRRP
jgi:hypothetical protein